MLQTARAAPKRSAKAAASEAKKPPTAAAKSPARTQAKAGSKPELAAKPAKAQARRKPATAPSAADASRLGPEQRRRHVELAAYFIAERRGFVPGWEHDDWVAAEAEIDRMVADGLL